MAGLLDDTSGFGGLLGNPLFNIGLATLAASGRPGATFGGAVGQGGLLGMQNLQQAQQAAGAAQLRDMQISEMRRKLDAQARLAAALKGASSPQTVPGFGGPEVTAFSNQYDPGVMAMPGSAPAPRAFVSSVAGQLSQPQTVAPQPGDLLQNPGVRSALFDLAPSAALTAFTKEGAAPKVETRYNPQSGREEKVQWNPATRQWVPLGGTKTDLLSSDAEAQKARIAQAGATRLTIDQRQPGAMEDFYGKMRSQGLSTEMEAPARIAKLDRLGALLDQVNTGKFAGTTLELKRAAKGAGIDLTALGVKDDVAPAQAAQALSQELALQLRNPAGGAGMPGAMSDSDRRFLESMVPSIGNDPNSNKLMLGWSRKMEQRSLDVARRMRAYAKDHNNKIDDGFFDELGKWSEAHPLFSQEDAKVPGAAGPATSNILRFDAQGNPL